MQRLRLLFFYGIVFLLLAGCGFKVFISDTRLTGPVPSPAEQAAATATAEAALVNATPTPSADEANLMQQTIDDLTDRIGEDLEVVAPYNGKETPNAGPLRGMRVEPGDTIRISSGRSQTTAVEAAEYCVQEKCSRVWVFGRPKAKSLGAWYPVVIFKYEMKQ
jgi:hypothetical protein